jgi:hypothetical protein
MFKKVLAVLNFYSLIVLSIERECRKTGGPYKVLEFDAKHHCNHSRESRNMASFEMAQTKAYFSTYFRVCFASEH